MYIETTRGTIQLELDVIHAPLTSLSFMALARRGYFDGIVFHRVVPNFVVQAGDPRGDGEGGPGYAIRDEVSDLPVRARHARMALSWADTGGSRVLHHDGAATAPRRPLRDFGRVVVGMDVVDWLRRWDWIAEGARVGRGGPGRPALNPERTNH